MTLCLALVLSHKLMSIVLPIFLLPLLGLLSGVKPHLKWLALVIAYSGNLQVRYDIVFSRAPFYINKTPNLPAIHFRDTYGTSNQPMGSNILAFSLLHLDVYSTVCPPYNAPRYNAYSDITRSTVPPEI